jgi:putative ABC transport system permease protein
MMGPPIIPVLKDYEKVLPYVRNLDGIKSHTSQMSSYAVLNFEERGTDFLLLFGVDPDDYFKTMESARIVEGMGRMLKPSEEGLMLHHSTWKRLKEQRDIDLKIGDCIQLNGYSKSGFKIREVTIVGIFQFENGNDRFFTPSIADIQTVRYLGGRNSGPIEKVVVDSSATALLDADIDSLFGDESVEKPATVSKGSADIYDILGAKKTTATATSAEGSWNFIVVRLKDGIDVKSRIDTLNAQFEENDINARAQGWWSSALPDSMTYNAIQILFNVFIIVLAFVSTIVIMNTLVASVMERTGEIGMMRALGARKSFVLKMFVAETSTITIVFGLLGILLGYAVVSILGRLGIPTDNDALRFLGGGATLRPFVGFVPLVVSCILMAIIGLVSWIFPVLMALKVSPLRAIQTE